MDFDVTDVGMQAVPLVAINIVRASRVAQDSNTPRPSFPRRAVSWCSRRVKIGLQIARLILQVILAMFT